MSESWRTARLGGVVSDLTASRTFRVQPDAMVVDPTIQCATHRIATAAVNRGFEVKIDRRIRIEPGDLVFSRLHTQNGAFAFSDMRFQATTTFLPLRVHEERVDRRFLFWALHKFVPSLSASDTVGRETFKTSEILGLKFPLPPLDEQKRVAMRIDDLAGGIREASALGQQSINEAIALFEEARASVYRAATTSPLVALDQLATLERGKFSHRPRNDPRFFGGNHPWIQISEIENSKKFIRKWSTTLNDDGLAISRRFPKGTVLISIAATIGATGILAFDCCVPDSIVGVTPRTGVDSEYLYHYLGYVRTHLEGIAPQSAQKNINLQILAPLPVPKLPLAEQQKIVVYLNSLQAQVDALTKIQSEIATKLDSLLPAILDRAFKGELR